MNKSNFHNLCKADEEAVDALVASGFKPQHLPAEQSERGEKINSLLNLLDHLPVEQPSGDLLAKTLSRVEKVRQQDHFSQQIQSLTGATGPGFRWAEVATVAAMLIIGVSLLIPMFNQSRAASRQYACKTNLAAAGMGFTSYARDNRGKLPAVKVNPGDKWWFVNQFNKDGSAKSNSAHVFVLIRGGYVDLKNLHCPENPNYVDEIQFTMRDWPDYSHVSYSYQNMFTKKQMKWSGPTVAVLADKNPLFQQGEYLENVPKTSLSRYHAKLNGQNVLMSSGRVIWVPTPVLNNGDNIWQIRGQKQYKGNETPTDEYDSFLVP